MVTSEVQKLTDDVLEEEFPVPARGEWHACTSCGSRSYMHFFFLGDYMSFCAHHGIRGEEKLVASGGFLVADYRDDLIENRQLGQP